MERNGGVWAYFYPGAIGELLNFRECDIQTMKYNGNMSKDEMHEILNKFREGLASILGSKLEAVYLYGSRARGDAHPDSDIDVLVILKDEFNYSQVLNETTDLAASLSLEYDAVISRAFLTKQHFETDLTPFAMNVRKEAIPA
jgi:uncharacterized protein